MTAGPVPRPRPQRRPGRPVGGADNVREALLERARELFLLRGFGNVSTRAIAGAAGTTPAMIHYHFGDKLGLYRAMIESVAGPLVEQVQQLGQGGPGTESPALEAVIGTYMRMIAANPWFPALLLQEVLGQSGRMRAEFIERFAGRAAPTLAAAIRRERDAGRLRHDIDPRFATVSLLSLCVFPFVSLPITAPVLGFRPEGPELERFIRHTAGLFCAGIAAAPETTHG